MSEINVTRQFSVNYGSQLLRVESNALYTTVLGLVVYMQLCYMQKFNKGTVMQELPVLVKLR